MTLNIPQADRMGVGGYVRYARTKIASCVRSVFFRKKSRLSLWIWISYLHSRRQAPLCVARLVFSTGTTFSGSSEFLSPRISREKYSVTACVDP